MRTVLQAEVPYISLQADPHVSSMSNNAGGAQLLDKTTTQQPATLHSPRSTIQVCSTPCSHSPYQRGGTPLAVTSCSTQKQTGKGRGR